MQHEIERRRKMLIVSLRVQPQRTHSHCSVFPGPSVPSVLSTACASYGGCAIHTCPSSTLKSAFVVLCSPSCYIYIYNLCTVMEMWVYNTTVVIDAVIYLTFVYVFLLFFLTFFFCDATTERRIMIFTINLMMTTMMRCRKMQVETVVLYCTGRGVGLAVCDHPRRP